MARTISPERAGAFVDAGALWSFTARTPGLARQDTLDSTLFAQLAADKVAARTREPAAWLESFFTTAGKIGWGAGKTALRPWRAQRDTFSVREVALDVLARHLGPDELALAGASITALGDLEPTARPSALFNAYGRTEHQLNVQIGVASGSAPHLTTVAVVFSTKQEITDVLRPDFSVELLIGDVLTLAQSMTLSDAVYAQVREAVIEKLGPRRTELVAPVEIGPAPPEQRSDTTPARKGIGP